MILINYKSKSYLLDPLENELIHETYFRLWKIVQHESQNDYFYEKLVGISKLWYYKKKFNCKYSDYNEKLIKMF